MVSPGAHGGTVIPLDEHAEDLLDPNRAPRGLRAVEPDAPELPVAVEEPEPEPAPAPVVEESAPVPPTEPKPKPRAKKSHPAVPAWEDVLLGVRSQRG